MEREGSVKNKKEVLLIKTQRKSVNAVNSHTVAVTYTDHSAATKSGSKHKILFSFLARITPAYKGNATRSFHFFSLLFLP